MKRAILVGFGIAGTFVTGAGCPTPQNYVQVQWDTTMRQMGIVPTFPPREDVYVGDIYATNYDPESKETLKRFEDGDTTIGVNPRWLHVSFLKQMAEEYHDRPGGPVTPSGYGELLTNATTQPTTEPTNADGIFSEETLTVRNRVVGFPEFTAVTFTQGNLSGLVPVEAVSIGFGASTSDFESVTVRIPSAESIGVDASVALAELTTTQSSTSQPVGKGHMALKEELVKQLVAFAPETSASANTSKEAQAQAAAAGKGGQPQAPHRYVWLRVMTEVYYARVVDISATSKTSNGLIFTGKPTAAPTQPTTQPILDPIQDPVSRAKALNDALAAAGASTFPNGSLQFVTATDRTISLRRLYYRPVAFGFRGFTLKVDLDNNGMIENVTPSTSVISQMKPPNQ